eukprot:COSAG04_NODE_1094_length_8313_cov_18.592160_6_plen_64_part_00
MDILLHLQVSLLRPKLGLPRRGRLTLSVLRFRARFPVVARTIAERLGKNHKSLSDWESHGMFM